MNIKHNTSILLVAVAGLLLAGCGPVYQTQYRYQPPRAFAGRRCVNTCSAQFQACRMRCQEVNDRRTHYQQQQADFDYWSSHHHYHHFHPGYGPNPYSPGYYPDDDSFTYGDNYNYYADNGGCGCRATYNSCYQNCGGNVYSRRVCVAFCGKQ